MAFKCIGTTHNFNAQEVLRKVSTLLEQGEQVPVKVIPEPDNQYDSKAITFQCKVDSKWHKIGYIVREALDDVHRANENYFRQIRMGQVFGGMDALWTWILRRHQHSP